MELNEVLRWTYVLLCAVAPYVIIKVQDHRRRLHSRNDRS